MKRVGVAVTAAMVLVICGTTGQVLAQVGMYNPPISPYIGLLRTGASPGVNWMNLVQPQMELYNAANQLQTQQYGLGQTVSGLGNAMVTTGHPVLFGSYLQYYGRGIGAGMGMGGVGTGGAVGTGGGIGMGMGGMGMGGMGMGMGGMGMGGMGMGGMGMGGMGMGGMGMGGMGMGGMGMGGMGMGGMGMPR